jgi:hypothetical protein
MRFTIEGYSQARLVELGLGYVEAALLRWLADFAHTGEMREITDGQGRRLWWVKYDAVAADLPVLGIESPDVMRRRFARLVAAGVLIHQHVQQRGRFSYYGFGPQYATLIATKDNPTEESSESEGDDEQPTQESGEGLDEAEHSTDESSEVTAEAVHSTVESVPIRPFGRRSPDSTVGTNDSSTSHSSTRTQEETARACDGGSTEHLPDHMALAVAWYKRYSSETCRLVAPCGDDFLAAQRALARAEPCVLFGAIEPYFAGRYWFTEDKVTKRRAFAFKSFLAHFPEVLASQSKPAIARIYGGQSERRCGCGALLPFGSGRFARCSCGRAWEIGDGGKLAEITQEMAKA